MNMKCPFCNNEIEDDAKFCTSCGKEIITEVKCPKCQTANSISSKFCKSCGAPLKEEEQKPVVEKKKEEQSAGKPKISFIFSTISSSLLLLSMVLMAFIPLIPLLYDNFFPINNFTMVSIASNLADYIRVKQYVGIANSSIAILLSVAILVVALIFIGLSIPKFVKAIKDKTFVDLSKKTTILYILVLGSIIYIANFALFQNGEIVTTFNGGLIFIVVLIAFALCFNLFTKEFLSEKHELLPLILRGVGRFPVDQARFYICQIILIFDYLHGKNIIYRDLKPENILIHKSGYLKLTDFGFAKIVEGRTYTLCGTPEYLAPEIILNKGHGKPVDWWTCGILLYEMIAGIDPFSDDDPMMVYQKILKGKIKFPSGFDSNAKSLIKHLLDQDLTKRYGNLKNGVKDITGHRFFKNFEWNKLLEKDLPPPYIPKVKSNNDISNFSEYPDSDNPAVAIDKGEDPFLDWFK